MGFLRSDANIQSSPLFQSSVTPVLCHIISIYLGLKTATFSNFPTNTTEVRNGSYGFYFQMTAKQSLVIEKMRLPYSHHTQMAESTESNLVTLKIFSHNGELDEDMFDSHDGWELHCESVVPCTHVYTESGFVHENVTIVCLSTRKQTFFLLSFTFRLLLPLVFSLNPVYFQKIIPKYCHFWTDEMSVSLFKIPWKLNFHWKSVRQRSSSTTPCTCRSFFVGQMFNGRWVSMMDSWTNVFGHLQKWVIMYSWQTDLIRKINPHKRLFHAGVHFMGVEGRAAVYFSR